MARGGSRKHKPTPKDSQPGTRRSQGKSPPHQPRLSAKEEQRLLREVEKEARELERLTAREQKQAEPGLWEKIKALGSKLLDGANTVMDTLGVTPQDLVEAVLKVAI